MELRAYFEPIINSLNGLKRVFTYFEIAGSYRRGNAKMKDVDVVCVVETPLQARELENWIKQAGTKMFGGEDRIAVAVDLSYEMFGNQISCQANVDFRIHKNIDEWPSGLLHFTGSKEFNIKMRARAKKHGYKLNEYGLWLDDDRVIAPSEAEIFSCLGMSYVPPEERS